MTPEVTALPPSSDESGWGARGTALSALSSQIKIPSAGADYLTFANHLGVDVAGAPRCRSAAIGTAHSAAVQQPLAC